MRVDQWLWTIRIFKSRTLAGEAVRRGHVSIQGRPCKPSAEVQPGQTIHVEGRLKGVRRRCILQVLAIPPSRVSAAKVRDYALLQPLPEPEPTSREPDWWDNSQWWGQTEFDAQDDPLA
ncbi:MAG: hypothetical protein RLZZ244_3125 [Verrucomicrobiota bacterium]|jgi:ribosomal 50S subunit-recycling heat shock protein